jgi:hypothetical protein
LSLCFSLFTVPARASSCLAGNYSTIAGTTCDIGNLHFDFRFASFDPSGSYSFIGDDLSGSSWREGLTNSDFYFTPLSDGFTIGLDPSASINPNSFSPIGDNYGTNSIVAPPNPGFPVCYPGCSFVSQYVAFAHAEFRFNVSATGGSSISGVSYGAPDPSFSATGGSASGVTAGILGEAKGAYEMDGLGSGPSCCTSFNTAWEADRFNNGGSYPTPPDVFDQSSFEYMPGTTFVGQPFLDANIHATLFDLEAIGGVVSPTVAEYDGPTTIEFSTLQPVPEPGSILLLGIGLIAVAAMLKKQNCSYGRQSPVEK